MLMWRNITLEIVRHCRLLLRVRILRTDSNSLGRGGQ